jgi:predicted PurR-regulated permease PerM
MFGFRKEKNSLKLDIPTSQLFKIVGVLLLIYLSYILQDVIILLFFSFILMAAAKPSVAVLQKRLRVPDALAVALVYISILLIFGGTIYFISKPLGAELNHFSSNGPDLANSLVAKFPFLEGKIDGQSFSDLFGNIFSNFGNALGNAVNLTFSAFGALFQGVTVFIISIYLLLEREKLLKFFILITRLDHKKFIYVYETVENQLGAWVRGQVVLGFVVGFFTYIGLLILGLKFALPLAVLAGILEIVPIIGPIISAVPVVLVGFSASPVTGLLSLLVMILVQQLENHILVPVVMKRAVGLSPVVTLVSVLIGSKLFGIVGSIIAVPVAAITSALINIYLAKNHIQVDEDNLSIDE